MNKLLLDTNLLYYAIDEASKFHSVSLQFIDEVYSELYTTTKNISEFLVSTTRGDDPTLTVEQALDAVEDFQQFMTVLYPDNKSFTQHQDLLRRYGPKGKKIHDYEIAAIALANGITQIATFNAPDFSKITEITIVNPQDSQ